jgi:hypothetical protein
VCWRGFGAHLLGRALHGCLGAVRLPLLPLRRLRRPISRGLGLLLRLSRARLQPAL